MKRVLGYLIGIALTVFGILGFLSEITNDESRNPLLGYTLASIFFVAGILMIGGVASRYGGGLWTAAGYLLIVFGVLYAITTLEHFLRKGQKPSSTGFLVCSVVLSLGIACVGQGHRRHLWKMRTESEGPLNLNSSAEPPPRSFMRSAPWAPGWLGALFGIWFVWHYLNTTIKLGTFLQAWKTEGFPIDVNGLDKWYTPVPSNLNAALVYEEAFTNLVKSDASNIEDLFSHSSNFDLTAIAAERGQTQEILARNRKTLELLYAATNYSQCRYSSVLGTNSLPNFSHLEQLSTCAELLALQHREYALDGHMNEAIDSAIALFALANSLAKEPFLGSQRLRLFCNDKAVSEIGWMLNFVALRDSDLLRLDAALRRVQQTTKNSGPYVSDFVSAMRTEPSRCIDRIYREHPIEAGLFKTVVVLTDREHADKLFYAGSVKECLKALNNPYPLCLRMSPDSRNARTYARQHGYFVSAYFMEQRANFCIRVAEDCARLRILQAVIAIERYRIANNQELPRNFKNLTPRFLTSVPEDPFDGYPLRYQRQSSDYAVYSIGGDMKDDGGQPWKKGASSYDVVIRVKCNDSKSGITSR